MRLEFYNVNDPVNGQVITWRLRLREGGPVVIKSAQRWLNLKTAKRETGEALRELMNNNFEVFDLTRSRATKTLAGPRKTPPRSSRAGS